VLILSETHRRPAARCVEDIVVYDYRSSRKSGLPGFMTEMFRRTWEMQEKETERCREKVERLEERVKGLEDGSWGREGAVEDMGSA
jgi:polyhydroxyalkanoate synthesis regulator phasin